MTAPFDLSGKVALVTGASSGLGLHFAGVLARSGAKVVLAARREGALREQVESLHDRGHQADFVQLDVNDAASIAAAAPHFAQLDILVNNAGLVRDKPALEQTEEDWDAVLDTNLKGAFFVAQAAAKAMCAHGRGGSIVNIASILGLRQASLVTPYATSKAAVIQLTKNLALELARYGVRVNAIAPGYFATDLNVDFLESQAGQAMVRRVPQRRFGELSDLDAPLLLLAGPGSAYMTGSVLVVDGGHLLSTL
ncbi:SDR family NAD(P)-dependent oxidoreductase [Sphingomonas tabacisoli]|uniref:SDR family NAD(P)-dependent oxidoreductase n=1 Tax=Sphingomonas tabacisoli TaxID=2249466 RepID=A0ABW4I1L8_9SPHN